MKGKNKMINDSIIKDYVEDYILHSNQHLDGIDIDAIVEGLHHVAFVNDMTIARYEDCDAFPILLALCQWLYVQ